MAVIQSDHGTISPGSTIVEPGFGQAFTIAPEAGYHVDSILVDGAPISIGNDPNLTGPMAGVYTYTFSNVGSNHTFSAVFARDTSTLNVDIEAGGSAGFFSISGPADFNDGQPLTGQTSDFSAAVPTGAYTVTFAEQTGYTLIVTANPFTVNGNSASGELIKGAVETVTGAYTIITYAITVTQAAGGTIAPGTTEVDHGADQAFTFTPNADYHVESVIADGESIPLVGDPITGNGDGTYTYTFSDVTSAHTIEAVFARDTGTLSVGIDLGGGSGGSYSISGPADFNSGQPLTGQITNFSAIVPTGIYTVTFADCSALGYGLTLEATSFVVAGVAAGGELARDALETVTGIYVPLGSLQVLIEPQDAADEGAAWRREGAVEWRSSGDIEDEIPGGRYWIEFKALDGWYAPQRREVEICAGDEKMLEVQYSKDAGSLTVEITSRWAALAGAAWRFRGSDQWHAAPPVGGAEPSGSDTLSGLAPGIYTVEFKTAPGWYCPPTEVEIKGGEDTRVVAKYVPFIVADAADYDGDGLADYAVYGSTDGKWRVEGLFERRFGRKGDLPAPGDYDGDGVADPAFFRPAGGHWFIRGQGKLKGFGCEGDLPVPADYDGDGRTDPALYRPSTGEWIIALPPSRLEANNLAFGNPPYPPFAKGGTIDPFAGAGPSPFSKGGDGGSFYKSVAGFTSAKPAGKDGVTVLPWGGDRCDLPVPGDYDGDGRAEPAVYNFEAKTWSIMGQPKPVKYGRAGELPVPADYDGDGRTDLAVVDLEKGLWRVSGLFAEEIAVVSDGVPVWGDFDGDGLLEVGVFDPGSGRWFFGEETRFGERGDVPLAR